MAQYVHTLPQPIVDHKLHNKPERWEAYVSLNKIHMRQVMKFMTLCGLAWLVSSSDKLSNEDNVYLINEVTINNISPAASQMIESVVT